MQWSPQQDAALKAVNEWLAEPQQQVFYLAGYAGTGKTTLAQHFAQNVGGLVLFGAYTGKAAHVLKQKGCPDASTIHQLIYIPRDRSRLRLVELERELVEEIDFHQRHNMPTGAVEAIEAVIRLRRDIAAETKNVSQPLFSLNFESAVGEAALVIIDECSMVDGRMGEDLLSFGTKVLVLGDPAQLPPVGGAGFFTAREPDFMLTEIHRQARDNPIIELATQVRSKERLQAGCYGSSIVISKHLLEEGEPLAADQLLVGRNATRRSSNRRMRQLLGIGEDWRPVKTDRLVCLRNEHDLGLLNGSIWECMDAGVLDKNRLTMTVAPIDIEAEEVTVTAWSQPFHGEDITTPWWVRKEAAEFDFGYALTVHKAQGSQWDNVMLFDESSVFRADKWRWLYTGITRAAERVTVVRL